jgi:hypothetical protein
MAIWNEPKSDYVGSDHVTPDIFNELAENEKYLKEIQATKITTAQVKDAVMPNTQASTRVNLVASKTLSISLGKVRKWFADLKALAFKDVITESDISGNISGNKISGAVAEATLAASATKLATARNIGLSGVTATAQSFNGSAAVTIPITAIPASLLTGTVALDSTGNAASATKLASARNIGLSGVTATAVAFDGSGDIAIVITGIPATLFTGTASIPTSGNAGSATKLATSRK